jgi:hypothetical protein
MSRGIERKLTAQVGTAEATVAQLATPAVTHIVVTPEDPLRGTEEANAVEVGVGAEDANEVQGDELPKVSDPPEVSDDIGDDESVPAEVVIAPAGQGVVGFAVTQAHRELAAPKTAPIDAPQLLITQF